VLLIEDSKHYQNLVTLLLRQQFPEVSNCMWPTTASPGWRWPALQPRRAAGGHPAARHRRRDADHQPALAPAVRRHAG
jgi:hypothetical protein